MLTSLSLLLIFSSARSRPDSGTRVSLARTRIGVDRPYRVPSKLVMPTDNPDVSLLSEQGDGPTRPEASPSHLSDAAQALDLGITDAAENETPQVPAANGTSARVILVTGCAGFIGMHVSQVLLARGDHVVCVDNVNDYYDTKLKYDRLARLRGHPAFVFYKQDITDRDGLNQVFERHGFDGVVHLAAQAGVRYSLTHPEAYIDSNLVGFSNILEACRHTSSVGHLVYASSSSVYGGNVKTPFSEGDPVDHPVSLYAATKRANELMAHTYSHLYGLPTTGLRFFTVYGPWGRPDMSLFMFTRAILEGKPIQVFNHGHMIRDFTYVDDIVQGIVRVLDRPATPDARVDPSDPPPDRSAKSPFRVFNIGKSNPVQLEAFIAAIERTTGRTAIREMMPMQSGDVAATHADTSALQEWTAFKPGTAIEDGIRRFVAWYRDYYHV